MFTAVSTFYRFMPLPGCVALREPLRSLCDGLGIKGILLLAPEGFNGTLAGDPDRLAEAIDGIRRLTGCGDLDVQTGRFDRPPFLRMKVRIKAEIVTMGVRGLDPRERTGIAVDPEAWNTVLQDPTIPVIDVRNGFEHAIGTFEGAVDPGTAAFGDFPTFVRGKLDPKRHKAVAMFCTGGIRCEKASAYMLDQGFETVYQLKGGILAYLARVDRDQSLWRGDCFVFDGRVAVGHDLEPADVTLCHGCRHPLGPADRAAPDYVEGVRCSHCAAHRTSEQQAGAGERHRQVALAERRGVPHLGTETQTRTCQALNGAGVPVAAATMAPAARDDARDDGRNESM